MNKLSYFFLLLISISSCKKPDAQVVEDANQTYIFPAEHELHEGTWLQWPHQYQYGTTYRNSLDETWVSLTKELVSSEKVHIIAYNTTQKDRIITLLNTANVSLANVDFKIYKTDDVWIRDNGPIYVRNQKNNDLTILDWGFNGWGNKANSYHCNQIPSKIAIDQVIPYENLNSKLVTEGGSIEIDGNGTLMACKSSILNSNRNPTLSVEKVESYFKQYLGVENFIWLDGQEGLEITDQHIDGFARFGNQNTIVTMSSSDLLAYDVLQTDINKLYAAKNKSDNAYTFLQVPLTQNNVVTTNGTNLGYKGSYVNYYIANTKVLVPNYNDPNDAIANAIIQTLYPSRTVVGIDVRNLYENGGMIHCVTQQQPK